MSRRDASKERDARRLSAEAAALYRGGALPEALAKFREVLVIFCKVGDRRGQGITLSNLGEVYDALGRLQEAMECFQQALVIACEVGDLLGEGVALNGLGAVNQGLARRQEALDYYLQALAIFRAVGDRFDEGTTMSNLGEVYDGLGRPQEALEHFRQALAIRREVEDRRGEGTTLNNLGTVYYGLGRFPEALGHYRQALAIAREVGHRRGEGITLNNLGAVYHGLGQPQEALEHFQHALTVQREVENHQGEGVTLSKLGSLYHGLGRFQEALEHFQDALTIQREVGDRPGEAATLNNLGLTYYSLWRPQETLEYYLRALAIHCEAGNRRGEAFALSSLGELYRSLGQSEQALEHQRGALTILRDLGDRQGEGIALVNLGEVCRGLGRRQEALEHLQQALAIFRELRYRPGEAAALNDVGAVYQGLEQLDEALEHHLQALAIHRELADRRGEGASLSNLGSIYRGMGQPKKAVEHLEHALTVQREVGDRQGEGATLRNVGLFYSDLGRSQEALEHLGRAIAIVEDMRGEILSEELRTSYFATVSNLYRAYSALLAQQSQSGQALHAAERGKARAFLDLLVEAQAQVRQGVDPHLREEEQRLLGEMRALRQSLIGQRSHPGEQRETDQISQLEQREQELNRGYQANQAEIRRRNPRYAALTQPEAWQLGQIQEELLDENTALLEYVLGEQVSLLFAVLRDDFDVFFPPPGEEIEAMVRELRAAVVYGLHRYPHGYELYRALVEPAKKLIRGKELLIVADGVLHYLPFALLLTEPPDEESGPGEGPSRPARAQESGETADEEERNLRERVEAAAASLPPFDWARLPYLIREHAIGYAPSATVAGMLRREVRERQQQPPRYHGQLAAFADPVVEGLDIAGERRDSEGQVPVVLQAALAHTRMSLEPIPSTRDEVWELAALVSDKVPASQRPDIFDTQEVHLRTGPEATKAAVQQLTSGDKAYRFFHIATHGLIDTEKPQFSGLVFTPDEDGDPFWAAFEIFNARIPSEMAVLSACNTGLGRLVSGEGVVALSRAFMYAGTPTVCVSLWPVADESTPRLMKIFYEGVMAGGSKAQAMQTAQLHMLDEGTFVHPFYWAPFVLIGERMRRLFPPPPPIQIRGVP